jgi:hypothetical protein
MTELERELRENLAAQADQAQPGAEDWGDLNRRIGRRHRHRRGLAVGVLAGLLVVTPAAGLAIAAAGGPGSGGAAQPGSVPQSVTTNRATGSASPCPTTTLPQSSTSTTSAAGGTAESSTTTLVPADSAGTGCEPTEQPLPPPGVQPADGPGARAAVEAAFSSAYNGGLASTAGARDAIENGASLASLMTQLDAGPLRSFVSRSTVKVRDVVFTGPTEASVRFDSYVETDVQREGSVGRALLINGQWVVDHDTACVDLRSVGVLCPGYAALHNG